MRHSILYIVIAVLTIAIGAVQVLPLAAGPIGGPLSIRPLSEIIDEGPHVRDVHPTHATLDLVTTIPVACAVVYGTDNTFGQIASDPDMAGAAIIDHRPTMGNLEPNMTYQYRLQGSDANGNLYVSEVYIFTTPGDTSQEINLAALEMGASIVDVSSNWENRPNDSGFGANKAIDHDVNSAWASNGDGDMAFITVALSRPGAVHAIAVWSREMGNGTSRVIDFTVISNTGERFRFSLPDAEQPYRFETPFTQSVETLRLEVDTSTGGNVGLKDFDVLTLADG